MLHALVDNILYDALTKSFIRDSHASQTGKGTDDGLMRLKTHMVDYYRREGHGADGWVLKGDVRHFFASIEHAPGGASWLRPIQFFCWVATRSM